MSSESQRRDGSRLGVDDPRFCKKCGAKIDAGEAKLDETDGIPRTFIFELDAGDDDSGWIQLEKCRDCWISDKKRKIEREAAERYEH